MNAPERIWITETTTPPHIALIPDQSRPWPQDIEYTRTSEVQRLIAEAVARKLEEAAVALKPAYDGCDCFECSVSLRAAAAIRNRKETT